MSDLIDELKSVPGRTAADYFTLQKQPGIGGWLILIAIGLVADLLQVSNGMLQMIKLIEGPAWTRLTDPTSRAFHPYFKTAIIYQAVAACFFLIITLTAVMLFFGRRRLFPKFFVVTVPLAFVVSFVGHYLWGQIPVIANTPAHATTGWVLAGHFIALHIWIPYFLVSKRVRRTFVC
jgi:hypothetical protein